MLTKGFDFDTSNLRHVASAEEPQLLHLARLQQSAFDVVAATGDSDWNIPGTNLYITGFGMNGNGLHVVKVNTPNERSKSIQTGSNLPHSHNISSMSDFMSLPDDEKQKVGDEIVNHMDKYMGGKMRDRYKKYQSKKAAIADGYDQTIRFTLPQKYNDCFQVVRAALAAADIRYREVSADSFIGSSVMVVFFTSDDMDVIKTVVKELEKEDIICEIQELTK